MSDVERRIGGSLYEGESVREVFDVGPTGVVVTTHRVFVASPGHGGIRQADLPGVGGVDRTTRGSVSWLVWGVALGVVGVGCLVLAVTVARGGLFDTPEFRADTADRIGAGGLVELVEGLLWVLESTDTVLLGVGTLSLLLGGFTGAYYWFRVREPTLTVRLAGGPDIHIPREHAPAEAQERLERLLGPEQSDESRDTGTDTRQV